VAPPNQIGRRLIAMTFGLPRRPLGIHGHDQGAGARSITASVRAGGLKIATIGPGPIRPARAKTRGAKTTYRTTSGTPARTAIKGSPLRGTTLRGRALKGAPIRRASVRRTTLKSGPIPELGAIAKLGPIWAAAGSIHPITGRIPTGGAIPVGALAPTAWAKRIPGAACLTANLETAAISWGPIPGSTIPGATGARPGIPGATLPGTTVAGTTVP
jgi:hypothetical protein